jgi:hypothetical protein
LEIQPPLRFSSGLFSLFLPQSQNISATQKNETYCFPAEDMIMKTAVIFGALILVIVSGFSLASVFAQETVSAGAVRSLAASASGQTTEPARTLAAKPGTPQPATESAFSLEKIIIGLGLSAVIVLAIFRWGSSSHRAKQDKAASTPDSPAP